jgi:hypothetical protein
MRNRTLIALSQKSSSVGSGGSATLPFAGGARSSALVLLVIAMLMLFLTVSIALSRCR